MAGRGSGFPPVTTPFEPQAGNFAAGGSTVNIPVSGRLDVYVLPGGAGASNLTANLRLGGQVGPFALTAGAPYTFDGRAWSSVLISPANASVLWVLVAQDSSPTWPTASTTVNANPAGNTTPVTSAFIGPTSIAAGTIETAQATTGANVTTGSRVVFQLAVAQSGATDVATDTYVALKGATSGRYYAVAFIGEATAGEFDFAFIAGENLLIVAANAGAAAHFVSGYVQATKP